MIEQYVNKLIENIPKPEKPIKLDLVLDGGAFNGSYLIGALYFLQEMEKRNYVKVERISGCSIGSFAGFLYLTQNLDLFSQLYETITAQVKKTHHFEMFRNLKQVLNLQNTENICSKINNKLYITYHNIQKGTKPVKRVYADYDDVISAIVKSSYIPFIIDGNFVLREKYIDGIFPYVFEERKDRQILYLSIVKYEQLSSILNIQNEKTNYNRLLTGLLDIHNFYVKQTETQMCSYVNDWSIPTKRCFDVKKKLIEMTIVYIVSISSLVKRASCKIEDYVIYKIISKVLYDVYVILLESYFL